MSDNVMGDKANDNTIDLTLTLQNALERGYQYIDDVFYDGNITSNDILELLHEYDYKLGKPKQNIESYFGFYAPKKKSNL